MYTECFTSNCGRTQPNIREAIEFQLESLQEDGLPIPKSPTEGDYVEVAVVVG